MRDQQNRNNNNSSISLTQQHTAESKNTPNSPNDMVFFSIDLDTGHMMIESSPANRKTELNPVGFYVGFSLTKVQFDKLSGRLRKRPYLVEKYIKTMRS